MERAGADSRYRHNVGHRLRKDRTISHVTSHNMHFSRSAMMAWWASTNVSTTLRGGRRDWNPLAWARNAGVVWMVCARSATGLWDSHQRACAWSRPAFKSFCRHQPTARNPGNGLPSHDAAILLLWPAREVPNRPLGLAAE